MVVMLWSIVLVGGRINLFNLKFGNVDSCFPSTLLLLIKYM